MQTNSWNQQSSQTGGKFLDQTRNNRGYQNGKVGNKQMEAPALNGGYLDMQNRYVVPGFAAEVFN